MTSGIWIVYLSLVVGISFAFPTNYLIKGVPYFSQITDYGCGDASLQMILGYYGRFPGQFTIANVMRTSSTAGTLSTDAVRGAHFSSLSSSIGIQFPDDKASAGYLGHPFGLPAYWADSKVPWMDSLKTLISSNIPVMVLMHFAPNGTDDGHFRVVVGYDDSTSKIVMHDPWARGTPDVAHWSYQDFLRAWNYIEPGPTPRVNPYFGAIVLPGLDVTSHGVQVNGNHMQVSASLNHPKLPAPFRGDQFSLTNILFSLDHDILKVNVTGDASIRMSHVSDDVVSFKLTCLRGCSSVSVGIRVTATISNWEDDTPCCADPENSADQLMYPSYWYTDILQGHLNFKTS